MATPPSIIQPPLDYYNNGPGIIISLSILALIATSCVALRFWSKILVRLPFSLDDYLVLAALIAQHGFLASGISMVVAGLGRDIRLVATENPNDIVYLFKALLASELTYGVSSCLVKLSVLAFYWRIFPTRPVKLGCFIIGSLCIGWCIAIEIVNLLQCRPLKAFWYMELQKLPETKCLDSILFFLGNSIANCCIDFVTLTLPIHEISKLHTSRSKKIGVAGILLLGSIAFAASLVRTITTGIMYREGTTNFTKQFVVPGTATVVEVYTAIIGACLPNMVPAYRKIRYGDPAKRIGISVNSRTYVNNSGIHKGSASANKLQSRTNEIDSEGSFERLNENENENELGAIDYRRDGHANVIR